MADLDNMLNTDGAALRRELLSIHGLGEETADDILIYAANKPYFVIDAYTRRIIGRVGLYSGTGSYAEYQRFFHKALPADTRLFNEYHALLGAPRQRRLPSYAPMREVLPAGDLQLRLA